MLYHRVRSPTQTAEDARRQKASREIWGREARGGNRPKVKAYVGPLPEGLSGIEFETDLPPDRGCPPGHAYWSGPRSGVVVEGDYAKIKVKNIRIIQ
jgi:hypothetical protein